MNAGRNSLLSLLVVVLGAAPALAQSGAPAFAAPQVEWVESLPEGPLADVPLDGYIELGIMVQDDTGGCVSSDTALGTVSVTVTDAGGAVAGQLAMSDNRVRWTPDAHFLAGATYTFEIVADNQALMNLGCGWGSPNVTKSFTVTTGDALASGAPAAPSELTIAAQKNCETDQLRATWSLDGPYIAYSAAAASGTTIRLNWDLGQGSLLTTAPTADFCLTLTATHEVSGETTATPICVSDATRDADIACPPDPPTTVGGGTGPGCGAGGPGNTALGFALLFCVAVVMRRRPM